MSVVLPPHAKNPKGIVDALHALAELIACKEFVTNNPCKNQVNTLPCADQGLPYSEFCDNCHTAWEKGGAIMGITGEEAAASVQKDGKKEVKYEN